MEKILLYKPTLAYNFYYCHFSLSDIPGELYLVTKGVFRDLGNPRVNILGLKVAYDLTLVETHNCAKFHQNWSKGVDFLAVLG